MLAIVQLTEWLPAIERLLDESELEGFRFVRRAKEEWQSGANRFSQTGEAFFGVFDQEQLVAIAGVNRESERCGRLRRFYVRRDRRRQGIGKELVRHALGFARGYYSRVVLRCDTDSADRFYRAVGFGRTDSHFGATHVIDLTKQRPNKSPEPTVMAVTPPAAQEPRHP